jgi:hypothetical protein
MEFLYPQESFRCPFLNRGRRCIGCGGGRVVRIARIFVRNESRMPDSGFSLRRAGEQGFRVKTLRRMPETED